MLWAVYGCRQSPVAHVHPPLVSRDVEEAQGIRGGLDSKRPLEVKWSLWKSDRHRDVPEKMLLPGSSDGSSDDTPLPVTQVFHRPVPGPRSLHPTYISVGDATGARTLY